MFLIWIFIFIAIRELNPWLFRVLKLLLISCLINTFHLSIYPNQKLGVQHANVNLKFICFFMTFLVWDELVVFFSIKF